MMEIFWVEQQCKPMRSSVGQLRAQEEVQRKSEMNQNGQELGSLEPDKRMCGFQLADRRTDVFLKNEHVELATPTGMEADGCAGGVLPLANVNFG